MIPSRIVPLKPLFMVPIVPFDIAENYPFFVRLTHKMSRTPNTLAPTVASTTHLFS